MPLQLEAAHAVELGDRLLDRLLEAGRAPFVGVDAQHPVVRRLRHGEVLLRAVPFERMVDHARAGAASDRYGIIAAARIDHDRFGSERRRRDARREIDGRVAGDHDERQGKRVRHRGQV